MATRPPLRGGAKRKPWNIRLALASNYAGDNRSPCVSSNNVKKTGPFDVKTVEALVALMTEHDLSEIYLRDGDQHVRLAARRIACPSAPPWPVRLPIAHSASGVRSRGPVPIPQPPLPPRRISSKSKAKRSAPFYSQAKPGEPPFVKVGDRVTPNKVVGLIEVMKTYNEIQANCTGVIVEVLVENGKYVDFGEVLFRVDPS